MPALQGSTLQTCSQKQISVQVHPLLLLTGLQPQLQLQGTARLKVFCCMQKSKDCPYKFATKLPAPSGNATWHVPEKIPDSTVYIRAWLWTEQADGTFTQTNYGRTKGNWQVCIRPACV